MPRAAAPTPAAAGLKAHPLVDRQRNARARKQHGQAGQLPVSLSHHRTRCCRYCVASLPPLLRCCCQQCVLHRGARAVPLPGRVCAVSCSTVCYPYCCAWQVQRNLWACLTAVGPPCSDQGHGRGAPAADRWRGQGLFDLTPAYRNMRALSEVMPPLPLRSGRGTEGPSPRLPGSRPRLVGARFRKLI